MAEKKIPPPPDFLSSDWKLLFISDHYWDPKLEDTVHVNLLEYVSEKDALIRDRLQSYWFGRSYRFGHKDGKIEGAALRPFSGNEAIKTWGLIGDEDAWVEAILCKGSWIVIQTPNDWNFGFVTRKNREGLLYLRLYFNDEVIDTFENTP